MTRRRLAAAGVAVAISAASGVFGPTSASADVTSTGSCVDGGGITWRTKVVWGSVYRSTTTNTDRVAVAVAGWTTTAGVLATDSTVKTYSGGSLSQTLTKTASPNYNSGAFYDSRNPADPLSAPGSTKITITVGRDGDGKANCTTTFVQPAAASAPTSTSFSLVNLSTRVSGSSVTASATVKATRSTAASAFGVCVRDSSDRNLDFFLPAATITTTGTTSASQTKTFAAGTYRAFACLNAAGTWHNVGAARTFTVSSTSPSPSSPPPTSPPPSSPPPTSSPSPTAPPAGGTAPLGVPGSWRMMFNDEFAQTAVDWAKWRDSSSAEADGGHGNKGNQQLEWNQGKNCSVTNGVLSMTAKPDNITSASGTHYDWSSCLLSSSPSYAFQYGYIETRSKLPSPKGFWPAFWTWQSAANNRWTETDVYEFYSDNHSRLYLSQHSGAGGGCQISPAFNPTTGFHTYGADIAPSGTTFYVDGVKVCTVAGTSTGLTNIILDNFVYSVIPPAAGSVGVHQVDYVRAWQR